LVQVSAHRALGARELSLHRVYGDAADSCDLRVGALLDVAEEKNGARFGGKPGESAVDVGAVRAWTADRWDAGVAGLAGPPARARARRRFRQRSMHTLVSTR